MLGASMLDNVRGIRNPGEAFKPDGIMMNFEAEVAAALGMSWTRSMIDEAAVGWECEARWKVSSWNMCKRRSNAHASVLASGGELSCSRWFVCPGRRPAWPRPAAQLA